MSTDPVTYNPQSGNYIAADGRVYNVVDMLGSGTPINEQVYDVNQYAPKCGLVLGSDGRMYDLPQLLLALAAKRENAQPKDSAAESAERKRLALLRASDPAMTLDRLGLTVPEGTTFKAWEPFLTRLGDALTGDVARYRQALRDLPKRPDWPNTPPEDWPQAPEGMNEN
jgi:hypothetical protein